VDAREDGTQGFRLGEYVSVNPNMNDLGWLIS
jgi:hypothetical protein